MEEHGHAKYKFGMVINLDKCTGCGTCTVACAAENNQSVVRDETDKQRTISWMQLYKITNEKPFPETEVCYFPRPCMHCHHHTPCVSVCPPTATKMDYNNGIVSQIYTRCIGCRYCQAACPYHARYFNWWDGYWPKGTDRYLSPEVSPRMRGVIEKCSFCHHRFMRAKEEAYAERRSARLEEDEYAKTSAEIDIEYQTACTEACPAQAITFGNLNNPDSDVAKLSKHPDAFRLLERLGTEPKVYYISSKDWVHKKADNYLPGEFERIRSAKG
jgi:molybdopterin-containing oxidoreductase family iron-sulfur binding subunit